MKGNETGGRKPAILIVDDQKDVLNTLTLWLEDEGFHVFSALNSGEAFKILGQESIEVVLLDFRLGEENGLKVARTLKETDEFLKIIMITGFPSHNAAVESMKSGVFDYISKDEFSEKMTETIRKAVRARELELLKKGQTPAAQPFLKFIVLCNHSLIKERLGNFSLHSPDFKLMKAFSSLNELENTGYVPEIDIVMICATCCLTPFSNAFHFFHELYKMIPAAKPVVFNENFSEQEKVDLIRIGVKGFFSIEMDSETLEKAFSLIKKGEMWTSRKLASLALPSGLEYLKSCLADKESFGLSSREKEILKAIVRGLKNNEIADRLFISENTVKTHINKIYKKFGVKNRAQAICFALDKKILVN